MKNGIMAELIPTLLRSMPLALSINSDGSLMASRYQNGIVDIWDSALQMTRMSLTHASPVNALIYMSKDKTIAAGCGDGQIFFWDTSSLNE